MPLKSLSLDPPSFGNFDAMARAYPGTESYNYVKDNNFIIKENDKTEGTGGHEVAQVKETDLA